eukprot:258876_1
MSTTTNTTKRRSFRLASKQSEKEKNTKQDRTQKKKKKKTYPSMQLDGDGDTEYQNGDCVWAKYLDYPWWPGQIEVCSATYSPRRKKSKRTTVTVRWFGGFPIKTNKCKLVNVIPWNPDDGDKIFADVHEENHESFQGSMDEANAVYLDLCAERGNEPIQSALNYEKKNTSHSKRKRMDTDDENADEHRPKKKMKLSKTKIEWNTIQVSEWISSLGNDYHQYSIKFVNAGVDGALLSHLSELDEDSLSDIVTKKLHRIKIMFAWGKLG